MRRTALILALLALTGPAAAQTSQKPIEIIVPFAPGASADGIARLIGQDLGLRLGRQVRLLAAEADYADDETFAAFLASESARWKEALAAMPASN